MQDINIILSIIGATTGCISLLLHLLKSLDERPKLKIEVLSNFNMIYFPSVFMENSNYNSDQHALIELRIINKSQLPITIYQVDICSRRLGTYPVYKYNKPTGNVTFPTRFELSYIDPVNTGLFLPITLEPYEVREGLFFISHPPKFIKGPYTIKLIFKSSRGIFRVKTLAQDHSDILDAFESQS